MPADVENKRFNRNIGLSFGSSVIGVAVAIAQGALIARTLGPAGKGIVAVVVLAPPLIRLLLDGGLAASNVYFIGTARFDTSTLAGHALSFTALAVFATAIIVLVAGATGVYRAVLPDAPAPLLILGMLAVPLGVLMAHLQGLLQGLERFAVLNACVIVSALSQLAVTAVLLVGFDRGAGGVVVASLLATATTVVVSIEVLRRSTVSFRPRFERDVVRPLVGYGMRGHVGELLQYFNYRLDVLIVNLYLGPFAVGIYSVSTRLAELLWYLPDAVSLVLFPRAAKGTATESRALTARATAQTLAISAVAALALAAFGDQVIRSVFSDEFASAYRPMLLLLPGAVLLGGGKVISHELAGRGQPHINSAVAAVSLVTTVVLDVILIPRMGISGAAIASTASYTLTFVLLVIASVTLGRRSAHVADGLKLEPEIAPSP